MEGLLRTSLYHTLRTNQMGYIKVKAQLPGIYGNVNRPCPRAAPSDSGQFTVHRAFVERKLHKRRSFYAKRNGGPDGKHSCLVRF